MKNLSKLLVLVTALCILGCTKKTDKERAIALVNTKYKDVDQKFNFDEAKFDSLYNISPKAYADSLKKGEELDTTLAVLESQIEHLDQEESDSVGLISAALTKQRYRLLALAKTKPKFIGWKLSHIKTSRSSSEQLSFNFDKEITKIVP
ncbi:hypothetical protein [Pedobacter sandarakinus]|uniref:hypothetical protein n=1 Tax=Pedobacter sandarakinus TaxID=353156 RepID=UPI0022473873|nr:hypothetical protein [Pedobacter sandarakinus]MCX2575985.1 hypothetical protein [Pedobacter sandarakinus]